MAWTYTESIPEQVYVACSGGVDSVAAAAILAQWRQVTLLHFSHSDHAAEYELEMVQRLASQLNVKLLVSTQHTEQLPGNSEAQWRHARYSWFHSMGIPVVTAHTLDDAVEWYLMTCLRGRGEFMPHRNKNVLRPFLLTDKEKMIEYCHREKLQWWEDPGNHNPDFSLRSKVRSSLIPAALACEPGIKRMVRRRLVEKIKSEKMLKLC